MFQHVIVVYEGTYIGDLLPRVVRKSDGRTFCNIGSKNEKNANMEKCSNFK